MMCDIILLFMQIYELFHAFVIDLILNLVCSGI